MKFHLLHPRDQLVTIMHRIYNNRMTTLSGGNLSVKEPNGNIWITPAATDKGQLVPGDVVCMRADGSIDGKHRPSSEYPFHSAIYTSRPDLGAVVHAHCPALVTFSIVHQVPDTRIVPHTWHMCGHAGYSPYALPGSAQLGENIAATFARGYSVVLLENHGVAAAGPDLLVAYQRLETLELVARTLLNARQVGSPISLTDEQLSLAHAGADPLPEFTPGRHTSRECELRQQVVHTVHRACDRFLMDSTQGVVSARVDDHSFVITPAGLDRPGLEIDDVVLVQDGQREAGKVPSRSVHLHSAIYDTHPDIHCVIVARPPNAMAYAVTGRAFDTRTIPESYFLLRDVPLLPFGARFHAPGQVAATVSPKRPVVLLQNDAVLAVGQTVLAAFDRLEVAEFTARSLIDTAVLGELAPIGAAELADLEAAFCQ